MHLSIIIPAYNEADRILRTVNHTLSYLSGQSYRSEVLIVSDGSTDGTREIVETGFAADGQVSLKVFEYHPNRGKGYAVRYGMRKGVGERVMFMDADYAVPIEALEDGIALLRKGADIAIGSRAVSGSTVSVQQNVFRRLSARVYTSVQNRYLGIPYKDTQCGFKLFSAHAAKTLFELQKLDSVIFDPEILWLAKRHGFKVAEFPVAWEHVENSKIVYDSFRKSLFVFKELFRIKALHRN